MAATGVLGLAAKHGHQRADNGLARRLEAPLQQNNRGVRSLVLFEFESPANSNPLFRPAGGAHQCFSTVPPHWPPVPRNGSPTCPPQHRVRVVPNGHRWRAVHG